MYDDITDRNQRFGIDIHGEHFIPFEMKGTNIYFESRVPSKWELQNCRIITMTDDSIWDPSEVQIAALETPIGSHDQYVQLTDNPLSGISDALEDD